jgi:F420-non-reducing hydrogenase iron-sulfur subunit
MVDPSYILKAFANGADGVLVAGCHPGDCHYISGNIKAMRRALLLKKLLEEMAVDKGRFRFEWIAASEPGLYVKVINEMTEEIRSLGPFSLKRGRIKPGAKEEVSHIYGHGL